MTYRMIHEVEGVVGVEARAWKAAIASLTPEQKDLILADLVVVASTGGLQWGGSPVQWASLDPLARALEAELKPKTVTIEVPYRERPALAGDAYIMRTIDGAVLVAHNDRPGVRKVLDLRAARVVEST